MQVPSSPEVVRRSRLRRILSVFLPLALIVVVVAILLFRTEILHWQASLSGRGMELAFLGFFTALLLLLLFVGARRLVSARVAEREVVAQLRQSETRLNGLLNAIPDLIWLKDERGVYLGCNPAFEQFFGRREQEIIGKTDYDFVDADLADSFQEHDRAALAAGVPKVNEEWITFAADGRRALIETIKLPLRAAEGELIGVLGISRDMTKRHDAEREASFLRNLVELSATPIYALNLDDGFRMVFANQAACEHFGRSREALARMRVSEWDPLFTPDKLVLAREQLIGGEPMHFETLHQRSDGSLVPVEVSASLLLQDGRQLAAGYILDISERKQAEAALKASHQQLLDLTSNVPGFVYQYRLAPDGRISFPFVGSTIKDMGGIMPADVYAEPSRIFSFVHPEDLGRLQASIQESAYFLHEWHHEFRAQLPKYGLRWLLGNASAARQTDGSTVWHGFITDITEIKRTEGDLQQSREQLRQLVAHQDRIREDERKRIARDIHDELGQHLLAMKIDISMLPQIVENPSALAERVGAIMRQIDSTVRSVRVIINNLRPSVLDLGLFAALEWQAKEFERTSGIICELVGNEEELQLEESLATMLFRVMQEGLTNVQRHADARHVRVELRRKGECIVMKVADDGVGIQEGEEGSGEKFGLVGIRERIGMLGGEATIESRDGTVLTISLPTTPRNHAAALASGM